MKISALNEKGQSVDYWFIYKVPKLTDTKDNKGKNTASGYEYLYYDPVVGKAAKSDNNLRQDKGALHFTLDSVFKNPGATTGWILYNDEKPADAGGGKDNGELGHTKGVLAFDTQTDTAYWLLHSWPKYADPDSETMPTPMFGQTFLCLSLDVATVRQIAVQMATYQQPQIYLPHIPASISKNDPLYDLSLPLSQTVPGGTNIINGKTKGGLSFKVIAKNREWGRDFWNDLVGPTLGDDMDVDTWIRGPVAPNIDSDGIHKTFDIKFVDLRKFVGWAWPETKDHAKWGITRNDGAKSPWVCVGDINRMVSQEKRGGGTIAFQDKALWQVLKTSDYIIPPPGFDKVSTKAMLKETHSKKAKPEQEKIFTDKEKAAALKTPAKKGKVVKPKK
ncbi:MAG TPA: deoxyribonuclease II family protein [Smithella sp.]|nr:deoxyribonuclease II family protein [Smithella sp.]